VKRSEQWRRWWRRTLRGWRRKVWETDVGRLPGLSDAEAANLRRAGIPTVEALLDRIAADGFDATVQNQKISRSSLRLALTRYALRETEGSTRDLLLRGVRFMGANWLEALLAMFVVVLVVLGIRAAGRPEGDVVPRRDLPAFHVIGRSDVSSRRGPAEFGVYRTAEDVVGRFPLRPVAAGEPLRHDQLSGIRIQRPDVLAGRRIISVPIPPHALRLALPGARVSLLLSPRNGNPEAGSVLHDIIVLEARDGGTHASLAVAVRDADLSVLARSLASADVFVLQQVTPAKNP
jgi:hypothetical protein